MKGFHVVLCGVSHALSSASFFTLAHCAVVPVHTYEMKNIYVVKSKISSRGRATIVPIGQGRGGAV